MSDEKIIKKREVSAGGIVYKFGDNSASGKPSADRLLFVLLIMPSGKTMNKDFKWTFPKGHIGDNKMESVKEAALREVKEETGVEAQIKADLGEVEFYFMWEGQKITKSVNWFLMEYVSGDTEEHDFEIKEARWFTVADADAKLTYKTDKEIFERAKQILLHE